MKKKIATIFKDRLEKPMPPCQINAGFFPATEEWVWHGESSLEGHIFIRATFFSAIHGFDI